MIHESIIRKLVDYILLNACSVNSSGLYNGKAGMALALFEAARYLQDEYIEEQAFDLLQESLLSKSEDISFENGLSGIGYVLLYLMKNDFIEADFDDLFKEQYEKIIESIEIMEQKKIQLTNIMQVVYFLSSLKQLKPQDQRIDEFSKKIIEAVEVYLIIRFRDFRDIHSVNNRMEVTTLFEAYLKLVISTSYKDFLQSVLNDYAKLYRSGRIISSYAVGHYLEILDAECKFKDVVHDNKQSDLKLHYQPLLSLKELVELAEFNDNSLIINMLSEYDDCESNLFNAMPANAFYAGYEQGISKLLFYILKNNNFKLSE